MNFTELYYGKVIDLLYAQYESDWKNARPGHCMKLSGLPEAQLMILQEKVRALNPKLDCFVIDDERADDSHFISATKLIELRNNETRPLFALIPTNSRTAAEDSYGNATFQNIDLNKIDHQLFEVCLDQFPPDRKREVQDIFQFLKLDVRQQITQALSYVLAIEQAGYTPASIGNQLFRLGLVPDSILVDDSAQFRVRLNYNQVSTDLLADFAKPVYERIRELPLARNTLQKDLVAFLRRETDLNTRDKIVTTIAEQYPQLNFRYWEIPVIDAKDITLTVEWLKDGKGNKLDNEGDTSILSLAEGGSAKLKVRFSMTPAPNQITELVGYKISLMQADGNVPHSEIARFKETGSSRNYRDKTIEIFANLVDVDTYYLKVQALDKDGNILNKQDEFKDPSIQQAWEEEKKETGKEPDPAAYAYKKTSDSDNFYIQIENEIDEDPPENRKAKLHNVLEAYFKYRIDRLKNPDKLPEAIPVLDMEASFWLESKQKKLLSTYYVKYHNRHHYQIICSRKLKLIEQLFLKEPDVLGFCKVAVDSNPSVDQLSTLRLEGNLLQKFAPEHLVALRRNLFEAIRRHCADEQGSFESFDWFSHKTLLDDYLRGLHAWIQGVQERVADHEPPSSSEAKELNRLCQAIGNMDMTFVTTQLPDGNELEVALLPPLHPLRLAWFSMLLDLFHEWEEKTQNYAGHLGEWSAQLEQLFTGDWWPSNHPLIIPGLVENSHFIYAGELAFGWGLYVPGSKSRNLELLNTRQVISYFRRIFNIDKSAFVDVDVSKKIVIRHLTNYIIQHPYVDKLVINIFNGGEGYVFADALVELEKDARFRALKYEIRLFEGKDKIIPFGQGFRELINPETNQSEEAEAFSQASENRLFPKLRYSVNNMDEYLRNTATYGAHLTFVINPFPLGITLTRRKYDKSSQFVRGLMIAPQVDVDIKGGEALWKHYIQLNSTTLATGSLNAQATELLAAMQQFTANVLASGDTESIPATKLHLSRQDNVLLSKIHDSSDWVVTLDRNIGPEVFDLPAREEANPFLLDYLPGEDVAGISSFLTTHPTSEILGLLGPHFEDFGIDVHQKEGRQQIRMLLEDLRAVSSSLILQLNSSQNKAFEVIGTALSKRVLEKKGILKNTIIIPIDLHQSLFSGKKEDSKSRADQVLITIEPDKREITVTVLEIKCRSSLHEIQKTELKKKIKDQVTNTMKWLQHHFDPAYAVNYDRLDRELKNYEFRSILSFYAERAHRYQYLSDSAHEVYLNFLNTLDQGFRLKFKQLGFIFDFSAEKKHFKEELDTDFTCFTFGKGLMEEILDDQSDLDTNRLEKEEADELVTYFKEASDLTPFLKKLREGIQKSTLKRDNPEITAAKSEASTTIEKPPVDPPLEEKPPKKEPANLVPGELATTKSKEPPQPKYEKPVDQTAPDFQIMVGANKPSKQFGLLGKTTHGQTIAIDLDETVTISLFGVQGGGKSYSIGSVMEMVLKPIPNVNYLPAPLAGVIFHFSESMDYEPEFTSMKFPNTKQGEIQKLKAEFGAEPDAIEDIVILTPRDKVEERREDYPSIEVQPIAFNSNELDAKAWMFLLGALNNDSTYIRQLKSLMRQQRNNLTVEGLRSSVEESVLLTNSQKALALQRLQFAEEYLDDNFELRTFLQPGRLIIVDLRDEFIMKDEALGLFVIMLNIFSGVTDYEGKRFNKFIVFDEAHKYMDNKDLAGKIVEAIREMRHKGVSIMIASQDPPSLPNEIIELSSVVITHKFNSPTWLKHIQRSITQLSSLSSADMSSLKTGEAFLWASKATENGITQRPQKIRIRPRATQHGGGTLTAVE